MDTQTIESAPNVGIEYNLNGRPSGITVDEWMDRLGKKLIDFYDFTCRFFCFIDFSLRSK